MIANLDLVSISKAGASGLCVVAVFYLTGLLKSLPSNASKTMHTTVRFYIIVVFLMALVLLASSWITAKNNADLAKDLQTQLVIIQKQLTATKGLNEKYRAMMSRIYGSVGPKVSYEVGEMKRGKTEIPLFVIDAFVRELDQDMKDSKAQGLIWDGQPRQSDASEISH
jgi:hypothetical protein